MIDFKELENRLKVKISQQELFFRALTHISYLNENPEVKYSNEKLEFLGDSIISFVVADYLYSHYRNMQEGEYTDIRGKLVAGITLSYATKALQIQKFILLSKGEEKIGGRDNPTILANVYEAIVGAIYLQSGLSKAKEFIKRTLIKPFLFKVINEKSFVSSKTRLQEFIQKKYHLLPVYQVLAISGPEHKGEYEVGVYFKGEKLGQGKGNSKKAAEEAAAKSALLRTEKKELEI